MKSSNDANSLCAPLEKFRIYWFYSLCFQEKEISCPSDTLQFSFFLLPVTCYFFLSFFFPFSFFLNLASSTYFTVGVDVSLHLITLSDTHTHSVELLCTKDRPVAEVATTDRHPCPGRDPNPQSQQASGRRPAPQLARQTGSAVICYCETNETNRELHPWHGLAFCSSLKDSNFQFQCSGFSCPVGPSHKQPSAAAVVIQKTAMPTELTARYVLWIVRFL